MAKAKRPRRKTVGSRSPSARGRMSRNKGAAFERAVGKALGAWWFGGVPAEVLYTALGSSKERQAFLAAVKSAEGLSDKLKTYFRRTAGSGGSNPGISPGDSQVPDDFPFHVEAKAVEGWTLDQIALGVGPFFRWWEQAKQDLREAYRRGGPERGPLLVFTRNLQPVWCATHAHVYAEIGTTGDSVLFLSLDESVHNAREPVAVFPIEVLLRADPRRITPGLVRGHPGVTL